MGWIVGFDVCVCMGGGGARGWCIYFYHTLLIYDICYMTNGFNKYILSLHLSYMLGIGLCEWFKIMDIGKSISWTVT